MSQKYVLITGASKGLGEFLARYFWNSKYNICLVARSEEGLDKVIDSLPIRKDQKTFKFICDISDFNALTVLIKKLKEYLPHLNVLINNAAIQGPIGRFLENDLSLWKETLNINLLATVMLCHEIVPWMQESGGGSIINISGGGATSPRENFSSYATSKAAIVRFSETLAMETRGDGIRVNCIAPGAMKTSMLEEVIKKGNKVAGEKEYEIARKIIVEGGASMERVAELALFLASDESNGITGKLISAVWDNWKQWPEHLKELNESDVYTIRRIAGRDRGHLWGDN